jgi:hypothetical protein
VLAGVLEQQARAGHKPPNGVGNEHLGRRGGRCDPRANVHGDASDFAGDRVELPRVHPRPDLDPEIPYAFADRPGASHTTRRPVERREEPVARRVDFVPAEVKLETRHFIGPLILRCSASGPTVASEEPFPIEER